MSYPDVCSVGHRALSLTGYFRHKLITYFTTGDFEYSNELQDHHHNNTPCLGIRIEDVSRWTPETVDKKPAILIKRMDWQNQTMAIFDGKIEPRAAGQLHARLWQGGHTFFCLATTGAAVEILSTEVARFFEHFGPVIRNELKLHQFGLSALGQTRRVKGARMVAVVPVAVQYIFEDAWALSQVAGASSIRTIQLLSVPT